MCKAAAKKGNCHRAHCKAIQTQRLPTFDIVFSMTSDAADVLMDIATSEDKKKIVLVTKYSKKFKNQDIPDPHYDGMTAECFFECNSLFFKFALK